MNVDLLDSYQVAAARVPDRLTELARIGADPEGGITRLPFSEAEAEAVDLFAAWSRDAGAEVVRDDFGNVFALLGDWRSNPGIMLGSHLDTVPRGGAYDGALGVVAAITVLETWDGPGPICAAAFRAEEATLSAQGRLGSSIYTGRIAPERAAELLDADPAHDLCGLAIDSVPFPASYVELHIEQGPRLEAAGRTIGAVTGIAGYSRWTAAFHGRADHVGTAPMDERRDALAAAAELILAIEQVGREEVDVGSVGYLRHEPNTVGVVARYAELTADLRSLEDEAVERGLERVHATATAISTRRHVAIDAHEVARVRPVRFPARVVDAIDAAASAIGKHALRLSSGANHDASNLAMVCPSGMVFVPSREGRSHSPDEYTPPEACEHGAIVLALAATSLAETGGTADE